MNILHISPYVPDMNAVHAGGVMMAKEIETLQYEHNVFIMGFINNQDDEKYAKKFDPQKSFFEKSTTFSKCVNGIMHLNEPTMFAIRHSIFFEKRLIENIKKWKIDVIHADYTAMGIFLSVKKKFPKLKFNLVEHDIVLQSYMRKKKSLYNQWQIKLIKKYEKKFCQQADTIFVLNTKDKTLLNHYYHLTENVYVLCPYYGIDTFGWQGNPKILNSICFIGNMGRKENDHAAKRLIRIFNQINYKEKYTLRIIGAFPSNELKSMSSRNVIITGFVEDIVQEIDQCKIAVFPLEQGAGVKFKVLQALCLGLPVITTNVGAEGIDEEGKAIILAENDNIIKEKIIHLLEDDKYYQQKSLDCKNWVESFFSWDKSTTIFHTIYKNNKLS